jgi:hypothetical protein
MPDGKKRSRRTIPSATYKTGYRAFLLQRYDAGETAHEQLNEAANPRRARDHRHVHGSLP